MGFRHFVLWGDCDRAHGVPTQSPGWASLLRVENKDGILHNCFEKKFLSSSP